MNLDEIKMIYKNVFSSNRSSFVYYMYVLYADLIKHSLPLHKIKTLDESFLYYDQIFNTITYPCGTRRLNKNSYTFLNNRVENIWNDFTIKFKNEFVEQYIEHFYLQF